VGKWNTPDEEGWFFATQEDCLYKKDGNSWLKFTNVSRARLGYFKLVHAMMPLSTVLHLAHVYPSKHSRFVMVGAL
jgi:hypothetical protein